MTSLQVAKDLGVTTFNYGAFITAVIDFLIMAFVIFLLVKGINKLSDIRKKPEEPVTPTTKRCPYCLSDIPLEATRCPHCTSQLDDIAEGSRLTREFSGEYVYINKGAAKTGSALVSGCQKRESRHPESQKDGGGL